MEVKQLHSVLELDVPNYITHDMTLRPSSKVRITAKPPESDGHTGQNYTDDRGFFEWAYNTFN